VRSSPCVFFYERGKERLSSAFPPCFWYYTNETQMRQFSNIDSTSGKPNYPAFIILIDKHQRLRI